MNQRNSIEPAFPSLNPRLAKILAAYGGGTDRDWFFLRQPRFSDESGELYWGFEVMHPWPLAPALDDDPPPISRIAFNNHDEVFVWDRFQEWIFVETHIVLGRDFRQVWEGTKTEMGLLTVLSLRHCDALSLRAQAVEPVRPVSKAGRFVAESPDRIECLGDEPK